VHHFIFYSIGSGKIEKPDIMIRVLRIPGDLGGETEFGWGPEDVTILAQE
jgi:hypothetical protein